MHYVRFTLVQLSSSEYAQTAQYDEGGDFGSERVRMNQYAISYTKNSTVQLNTCTVLFFV